MKKRVLSLALAALLAMALAGCGGEDSTGDTAKEDADTALEPSVEAHEETVNQKGTAYTTDFQDGTNEYHISGILFEVPSSWRAEISSTGDRTFYYPPSGLGKNLLMLSSTKTEGSIEDELVLSAYKDGIERGCEDFVLLQYAYAPNENGVLCGLVEYTYSSNGSTLHCYSFVFDSEDGFISLTFAIQPDWPLDYSQDMLAIIDSVREEH